MLRQMMAPACLLVTLLTLSACGNATATDKTQTDPETKTVNRTECLAMEDKDDKIACFNKLANQRKNELVATKERIEYIRTERARLRKENEKLLKEFERGVLDEE